MWSKHGTCKLAGRASNTKYTTLSKAITGCIGNSNCKGVTKVGSGNFRLSKSGTPIKASGKTCFVKGSAYTTVSGK